MMVPTSKSKESASDSPQRVIAIERLEPRSLLSANGVEFNDWDELYFDLNSELQPRDNGVPDQVATDRSPDRGHRSQRDDAKFDRREDSLRFRPDLRRQDRTLAAEDSLYDRFESPSRRTPVSQSSLVRSQVWVVFLQATPAVTVDAPTLVSSRAASGEAEQALEASQSDTLITLNDVVGSNTPAPRDRPPEVESALRLEESPPQEAPLLIDLGQHEAEDSVLVSRFDARADVDRLPQLEKVFDVHSEELGGFSSFRVPESELDTWLQRALNQRDRFAELEELLDTIASERKAFELNLKIERRPAELSNAIWSNPAVDPWNETPSEMILLTSGLDLTAQAQGQPATVSPHWDHSGEDDWTVGIGFHHVFEGMEMNEAASIAAAAPVDEPIIAAQTFLPAGVSQRLQVPPTPETPALSQSSNRALGVLVCCIGAHYLKNRKSRSAVGTVQVGLQRRE
ncbi:MAG: hypothetical protein MI861_14380 [Pirellulales bacterium]|nr:hypothetical protein [Pirellulales bacterium]